MNSPYVWQALPYPFPQSALTSDFVDGGVSLATQLLLHAQQSIPEFIHRVQWFRLAGREQTM